MTKLPGILENFRNKKIFVLGDYVADEYLFGSPSRISREAPVLILRQVSREVGLGGAGNALNNLICLGCQAIPIGVVGDDEMGEKLSKMVSSMGKDTRFLLKEKGGTTTTKTRVLAGGPHTVRQQVVRIDQGEYDRLSTFNEDQILKTLDHIEMEADALLVSDYQYGVLSSRIIEKVNAIAQNRKIIVTVDSRYQMLKFRDVTALTPNEPEVEEATGISINGRKETVQRCGQSLLTTIRSDAVLITRGNEGMALFLKEGGSHFLPIHGSDEVADVVGAGDTVTAIFTLALVAGGTFPEAMHLANVGGGIVVTKRGAATVNLEELREAIGRS